MALPGMIGERRFEFYYQSTFQLASRRVRLLAFTIQILFEKELARAKREECDVSWVRVASNFICVGCKLQWRMERQQQSERRRHDSKQARFQTRPVMTSSTSYEARRKIIQTQRQTTSQTKNCKRIIIEYMIVGIVVSQPFHDESSLPLRLLFSLPWNVRVSLE